MKLAVYVNYIIRLARLTDTLLFYRWQWRITPFGICAVFDNEEHSILLRPHGNAKKGASYVCTIPSTLQKLRKVAVNVTPKFAICDASGDMTASTNASSA